MNETVLKVEGLYKKFCRNLKYSMYYGITDAMKGLASITSKREVLRKHEFWALENISFELKRGEILGIIGKNGSGKSTLLRLLTGIFPPDKGRIEINGQVGSLIAVGAGFHPYMSGRENIFLNGILLGMSKLEVKRKFDEIVEFAEIGDFLDAPVASYSSGMKVRLGFSVAVHRVPEILLVDEVLSVGDLNFRKKCMSKMEEIKNKSSIVFISHNMNQVQRLCNTSILLQNGKVIKDGNTDEIISLYYNSINYKSNKTEVRILNSTNDFNNVQINILDNGYNIKDTFIPEEEINFNITVDCRNQLKNVIAGIAIINSEGIVIGTIKTIHSENPLIDFKKGLNCFSFKLVNPKILPDNYSIKFLCKLSNNQILLDADGPSFQILTDPNYIKYEQLIKFDSSWKYEKPKKEYFDQ